MFLPLIMRTQFPFLYRLFVHFKLSSFRRIRCYCSLRLFHCNPRSFLICFPRFAIRKNSCFLMVRSLESMRARLAANVGKYKKQKAKRKRPGCKPRKRSANERNSNGKRKIKRKPFREYLLPSNPLDKRMRNPNKIHMEKNEIFAICPSKCIEEIHEIMNSTQKRRVGTIVRFQPICLNLHHLPGGFSYKRSLGKPRIQRRVPCPTDNIR